MVEYLITVLQISFSFLRIFFLLRLATMSMNVKSIIDRSCKFLRAVEEAFFLLDRDQNRLITTEDFITVAKSVGKSNKRRFRVIRHRLFFLRN